MHEKIAQHAIEQLQEIDGVAKLILYGSVARGDYHAASDVDIAFICDDMARSDFVDLEGIPLGLKQTIDDKLQNIPNPTNIPFHVAIYWHEEYERGIELCATYSPPDLLHEVGIIKYDFYEDFD